MNEINYEVFNSFEKFIVLYLEANFSGNAIANTDGYQFMLTEHRTLFNYKKWTGVEGIKMFKNKNY